MTYRVGSALLLKGSTGAWTFAISVLRRMGPILARAIVFRMKCVVGAILAAMLASCHSAPDPTASLAWAYPHGPTSTFGQPLPPGPFRVPGSALVLTRDQVGHAPQPIDWHPEAHPPAPPAVGGPAKNGATPCAECHLLNGAGFPASANLAGLPAAYIIEQVQAFRSGQRTSARAGQPNTAEMIKTAKAVTPAALREAADYYAHLPRPHWLKVVEGPDAPRTVPDTFGWLNAAPGGGTEPLGDRIVELSDDLPRMMIGDDAVMLVDHVPPGAIARGRQVTQSGGAGGVPCKTCHGEHLGGMGAAPPITGRPAGYVARTLWDLRSGTRQNPGAVPMGAIARGLTPAQIRDLAAFLASVDG